MNYRQAKDEVNPADPQTFVPPIRAHDWFISALTSCGSLQTALSEMQLDLRSRFDFVMALQQILYGHADQGGLDAMTRLSMRLNALAHSVKVRLSMLNPQRESSWFRAPPVSHGGPFGGVLLPQPIFAAFAYDDGRKVQRALSLSWQRKNIKDLPFRDQSPCLWRTLLQLNAELSAWGGMPAPFADLNLRAEHPHLAKPLTSPSLLEFLKGIRLELARLEEQMASCYEGLRAGCAGFWQVYEERRQRQEAAGSRGEQRAGRRFSHEGFPARSYKSPKDLAALKFMGFRDFPPPPELRQRYLALARQFHPDRQGGDEQVFKQLQASYSHLLEKLGPATTRTTNPPSS